VSANCLLERCKERGSVGGHLLNILPFILQAEGEAGICHLGVPLSNNAEGLHRHNPILQQHPFAFPDNSVDTCPFSPSCAVQELSKFFTSGRIWHPCP
jgi:hypothetical protein